MAIDWYLRIDGDVTGPFRPRELRAMARAGKIPPHAYLRHIAGWPRQLVVGGPQAQEGNFGSRDF
jgi:GYF domain 2